MQNITIFKGRDDLDMNYHLSDWAQTFFLFILTFTFKSLVILKEKMHFQLQKDFKNFSS